MTANGKGSKPRPFSRGYENYATRFDQIKWGPRKPKRARRGPVKPTNP